MKSSLSLAIVFLACLASSALAGPQHGTAESGYWPMGYNGDTFTGVLTASDDASRCITLTYTNPRKQKTETLTAVFRDGYTVRWSDGTTRQIKPSDLKIGSHLKIYYLTKERKVKGQKVKTYTIWQFKTVADS